MSLVDPSHDLRVPVESLEAWREFARNNDWAYDRAVPAHIAMNVKSVGIQSRFSGFSRDVEVIGENWRETIVAHGLNSRGRGVIDEFADVQVTAKILMLEAVTPFARALQARFPFAVATEYLPTEVEQRKLPTVRHCDITATSFPDGTFDYVVSNDVLEHVADLAAAMRETRRILKHGGICLATFPFAAGQHETLVKARLENGEIVHLLEPEYHGNPVDPKGSLVFAIPGWDVLDLCRAVGFTRAEILFVSSVQRGITGTECAGVFILRAEA